jgi:hypothetical protein
VSMAPFEFPQGVGWVVVSQEPDQVAFQTPGQPVQGVNITFVTAEGNSGVVFVDNGTYRNVRKVHAALEAQARLVDQVSNLTSASFRQ